VEYKHLSFPLKLMLGYLVGILLLTLLFSISMGHLSTISRDYDHLVKNSWRQLDALQSLQSSGIRIRLDIDSNLAQARMDLKQIDYWFLRFLESNRGGSAGDFTMLVRDFHAFRLQALRLIDALENKAAGSELARERRLFMSKYEPFVGRVFVEIERSRNFVQVSETNFLRRINELLFLNTILAPLSFLFLYVYGYFISNHTGLRLRNFLLSMRKIVSGDYKQRIDEPSQDEIGQIAQGMNELANRLGSG